MSEVPVQTNMARHAQSPMVRCGILGCQNKAVRFHKYGMYCWNDWIKVKSWYQKKVNPETQRRKALMVEI
jgi:hypothetical protein